MSVPRQSRSWYSKVGLHAALNDPSGTSVAGQRRKLRYGLKTGFALARLRDDQQIDPNSAFWCNRLYSQVLQYGTNVNIGSYTFPVYEAKYNTPKIHLADVPDGDFMNTDSSPYAWGSGINWPWEGAQQGGSNPNDRGWRSNDAEVDNDPALGGGPRDRSLIVIDPSEDTMYEAWQTLRTDAYAAVNYGYPNNPPHNYPNVSAQHGGKVRGMSQFSGAFPNPWGLTGTSISAGVGMILYSEVQQGVIPHVIKFAVATGTVAHRRPAQRGDQSGGPNDFPEGSHIRLPYDFDIAAYCASTGNPQTPFCMMVMQAAKDYGMVCNDATTANVGLAGCEDLRPEPFFLPNNLPWYDYMMNPVPVTFTGDAGTNVLTATSSGVNNGLIVLIRSMTGGAGLSVNTGSIVNGYYRVINATFPTFQLALEGSTTPIDFTTNITSGSLVYADWGFVLCHPNRFPWQYFQLLPEVDG